MDANVHQCLPTITATYVVKYKRVNKLINPLSEVAIAKHGIALLFLMEHSDQTVLMW